MVRRSFQSRSFDVLAVLGCNRMADIPGPGACFQARDASEIL